MATTSKRIILSMAPFAWVHLIQDGSPGTITELWQFDNLADGCNIKLPNSATQESNSDNVDITRGDGAIIRFPKFNLVLDGQDESDITPAGSGADATGKAEITLITNEAPLPVTIQSWTAWLADIEAKKGDLLMVTIPTGLTYDSRENQYKADGYIYVIAKITNDIEQKLGANPSQMTLVFSSNKCSLTGITSTIIEAASYTPIVWKGKSQSFTPPSLSTGDGDNLIAGDIVIKEDATYTY